jgi:hypothetical protein
VSGTVNPFQEKTLVQGRIRVVERRRVYAQALLAVLKSPDTVETLDWQLADVAIKLADIEAAILCEVCSGPGGRHDVGFDGWVCPRCVACWE